MNGYDLLKFLTEAPRESLDQEILFEVELHTAPDKFYAGQVPIIKGNVMPDDQLLTPSGHIVTPDQAMDIYHKLCQEVKDGELTSDSSKEEMLQHLKENYTPFFLPKIFSANQILFKLQALKGYNDTPGQSQPDNPEEYEIYDPAKEVNPNLKISHWGPVGES